MHVIIAAAAGLAVGVFCPSIARKIKAIFVKEATAAKVAVSAEVPSIAKKL